MQFTYLDTESPHEWNQESGMPGVGLFATAVQVWSSAQQDPLKVTINDAALAFNVTPALIRQAVEYHPYMLVGAGDVIEHDGD